jgi:hypothetical protein
MCIIVFFNDLPSQISRTILFPLTETTRLGCYQKNRNSAQIIFYSQFSDPAFFDCAVGLNSCYAKCCILTTYIFDGLDQNVRLTPHIVAVEELFMLFFNRLNLKQPASGRLMFFMVEPTQVYMTIFLPLCR